MDSISSAERILRVIANRADAASMAGDLFEERPRRGAAWFWFAVTRIVLARLWRWPLGIYAALYLGSRLLTFYMLALYALPLDSPHRATAVWQTPLSIFSIAATILSFIAITLGVRYGLRDRMARLSAALVLLLTPGICFWWQPAVLPITLVLFFIASVVFLKDKHRRRTAVAVAASSAISLSVFVFGGLAGQAFQHWLVRGPYGTKELQEHPIIIYLGIAGYFVWSIATAAISSRIRQWLNRATVSEPASPPEETHGAPQPTV